MPTATIGKRAADTYAGFDDGVMVETGGTYSGPTYDNLRLDTTAAAQWKSWIVVDFPVIASVDSVTNAGFSAYSFFGDVTQIAIQGILKPWVVNEISWPEYASGLSWDTAGGKGAGDRDSWAPSTVNTSGGRFSIPGPMELQVAVGIALQTGATLAFMLEAANGSNTIWASSEHADGDSVKPYFTFDYTTSGGGGGDTAKHGGAVHHLRTLGVY